MSAAGQVDAISFCVNSAESPAVLDLEDEFGGLAVPFVLGILRY
jgi:hypothetical protein